MPWYYNQSSERIEVTAKQLLSLAKNGEFAPDTRIEISEGNIIPAREIGITNREGNRTKLSFWYYFNERDERINGSPPESMGQ